MILGGFSVELIVTDRFGRHYATRGRGGLRPGTSRARRARAHNDGREGALGPRNTRFGIVAVKPTSWRHQGMQPIEMIQESSASEEPHPFGMTPRWRAWAQRLSINPRGPLV